MVLKQFLFGTAASAFLVVTLAMYIGLKRMRIRASVGPNGYGYFTTAQQVLYGQDLEGLTILVTGGNSGLGFESARTLAKQGASVVLVARSLQKAHFAIESIQSGVTDQKLLLTPLACDLSSLLSIKQAVEDFKSLNISLNVLINNAGIMGLPDRNLTIDGFEKQMGVNHLGHFYLTNLLLPFLIKSASKDQPSRIVSLSSSGHTLMDSAFLDSPVLESKEYNAMTAYGNSKMANILHAQALNDRFMKQNVFSVSVHPGGIATNLGRNMNPSVVFGNFGYIKAVFAILPFLKSIPEGTSTQIYAAVRAPMPATAGQYFADCNVAPMLIPEAQALFDDISKREQLWMTSEKLISHTLSKIDVSEGTG